MEEFKRRMRLRWFFKDRRTKKEHSKNEFKLKSNWNPPKADPLLKSCLSILEKKVLSIAPEFKSYPNLSPSELSAFKFLKSDFILVIKEVDKGSAVVVWDRRGLYYGSCPTT